MKRWHCWLGLCLTVVPVRNLPAQAPGTTKITFAVRGGLASPNVSIDSDSAYRGDVQVTWQGELGIGVGRRMTLGLEVVRQTTPGFGGDCFSPCPPLPDYTAVSARLNWAPGGGNRRPPVLLSGGVGVYRLSPDFHSRKSTKAGAHLAVELPLLGLQRVWWIAPALRADVVPGVGGSAMYVVALTLGVRYWGL